MLYWELLIDSNVINSLSLFSSVVFYWGLEKRERERERVFLGGIFVFGGWVCGSSRLHLPKLRDHLFTRRRGKRLERNDWRKIRAGYSYSRSRRTLFGRGLLVRTWRFSSRVGPFVSLQLTDSNKRRGRVLGCLDRETVERSWWELRQEIKIDYRPAAGTIKRRVSGWKKTNSDVLRDRGGLDNKLWQLSFPSSLPRIRTKPILPPRFVLTY